jgi:hypothetical protein
MIGYILSHVWNKFVIDCCGMSVFKHSTLIHLFFHSPFSLQIVQQLVLIQHVWMSMWVEQRDTLTHRLVAVQVR